jgi:hypothetical protein
VRGWEEPLEDTGDIGSGVGAGVGIAAAAAAAAAAVGVIENEGGTTRMTLRRWRSVFLNADSS